MKRIILFLLCLLLAAGSILGLTACNSKTESADTSQNQSTEIKAKDWENYLSGTIAASMTQHTKLRLG